VKLWADACVTPTLEGVAHARGYEGTSNRQRGLLAALDPEIFRVVIDEDWVLITNNELDFRKLAAAEGLHPGLIILPQGRADQQRASLHVVLDFIEAHAADEGEEPWAWMVSRVVVYDDGNRSAAWEWIPDPPGA
jgi:predicted nuclease of predicted toxin-antitoxin system